MEKQIRPDPNNESFFHEVGPSNIRIFNKDCIAGMREDLEPGSVEVVVTSPPYNIGTDYGLCDDTIPRPAYLEWMDTWALGAKEVLSDAGSLFLVIGGKPSDRWGPHQVLEVMGRHFHLQNEILWVKSLTVEDRTYGHFKPINSPRYLNDCYEYIFHLTKGGAAKLDRLAIGVEYQDKSNVTRWGDGDHPDRRCRGNTWFVPYKTIQSRNRERPHPATFPVEIPEMCIQLHGVERVRRVLDPFLGIGNTALACTKVDVDFVGFEICPQYYAEACKAIEAQTPATSVQDQDSEMEQLSFELG